ncbi:MAG: energy transducer TonB [Deltaproteobacteria bacterium]|nr:energy transducer TonB [Deltaproteobacteria bacterium]
MRLRVTPSPVFLLACLPALAGAVEEDASVPRGASPAIHEEPSEPEEPFPVDGWPWDARVLAFLLPVQDVSWLTDDAPFHTCSVNVTWAAGTEPVARAMPDCHPPMVGPCEAATRRWRFEPLDASAAEGETRFAIRYVYRYSEQVGATTLHVEVDPGEVAAFDGWVGPPGVKLVHPARVRKEVTPRLPRSARKAGMGAGACPVTLTVDPGGRPREIRAREECPEVLREAGLEAASRWRFSPRVVDAVTAPETLTVVVAFR